MVRQLVEDMMDFRFLVRFALTSTTVSVPSAKFAKVPYE
jgi:hypothetical protein